LVQAEKNSNKAKDIIVKKLFILLE
jgi:hypothetical protein